MPEPKVIFENEDFLALIKPAGLLVHPARARSGDKKSDNNKIDQPTLTDWLTVSYPEVGKVGDDPATRPGLVHRLDKDTSGVMLVARTQEYFEYLKKLFQAKKIQKTYLAVGWGWAKEDYGKITASIGIKSGTTKRSIHSSKMLKTAETDYEVISRGRAPEDENVRTSFFKVMPRTGRTHQIRVHLASIGHPIAGDPIYGPRKSPITPPRLMLHAYEIEFERRPGERLCLNAVPDEEFLAFLSLCGLSTTKLT